MCLIVCIFAVQPVTSHFGRNGYLPGLGEGIRLCGVHIPGSLGVWRDSAGEYFVWKRVSGGLVLECHRRMQLEGRLE